MVFCYSSRCSVLKVWVSLYMLWFLIFISEADPRSYVCPNTTTYTPNSTYQVNLNSLLSTLSDPDITRNNLFYNATAVNSAPDRAYGLFMCRGDVTFDTCHDCVVTAIRDIVERCPREKQARTFYDLCVVRYENQSFFSTMDASLTLFIWNPGNVSEPDRFAQVLGNTMNDLATRASSDESANGGRLRGFATKEANFTSFQTLYNLVQCTQIYRSSIVIGAYVPPLAGNPGAWILLPSCNIRYEMYPFYNSTAAPPPPSPTPIIPPPPTPGSPTSPRGNRRSSAPVIIDIILAVVVSIFLLTLGFCFLRKRAKQLDAIQEATGTDGNDISATESLQYDLNTILAATNNLSAENKIGEGGFSAVFKDNLSNGQEIAVKRLSKTSTRCSRI